MKHSRVLKELYSILEKFDNFENAAVKKIHRVLLLAVILNISDTLCDTRYSQYQT